MWAHTPNFGCTPWHSGAVVDRVVEQFGREHAVGDASLLVVDVVDEAVERHEALDEAALDDRPLAGLDDPGDDVERPRPVDVGARRSRR